MGKGLCLEGRGIEQHRLSPELEETDLRVRLKEKDKRGPTEKAVLSN